MRNLNLHIKTLCIALFFAALTSCSNNDGYSLDSYRIAYVTARPLNDKAFYLTMDNGKSLWPAAPLHVNYQPERPQRVQINYTLLGDNYQGYDYAIKLNRLDTILTKMPAPDMGKENDSVYGKDPIGISDIWIGEEFLNVICKMEYSGRFKHAVNLLRDTTGTSFTLELRHNAFNDYSNNLRYGILAFDLSQIDTGGKDMDLIIRVKTFEGMKEYKRTYNSSKGTKTIQPELKLELQPELNLDKNSLE
jgi:hypothetical protein